MNAGDIMVNAAKAAAEKHLYVSTRDAVASVVWTIFLVKADGQGSQVAVIQGEVHAKQGGFLNALGCDVGIVNSQNAIRTYLALYS